MPPLEALRSPIRLKMEIWSEKRTEWHDAVNKSLALLATEPDCFQELERVKQIALDCARTVLGTTGGKGLRNAHHLASLEGGQATQDSPHSPESRSTRGACLQGAG